MESNNLKFDYRDTEEGKRRFFNKKAYSLSLKFQEDMAKEGVAIHNHFSDECTIDFSCCEGNNIGKSDYKIFIPSFRSVIKQSLQELFEECKHGDLQHQNWLKNKFEEYLNKNF